MTMKDTEPLIQGSMRVQSDKTSNSGQDSNRVMLDLTIPWHIGFGTYILATGGITHFEQDVLDDPSYEFYGDDEDYWALSRVWQAIKQGHSSPLNEHHTFLIH